MGLIKEPKNVDMSTKSKPWTNRDLADFRKLMNELKAKNKQRKRIKTDGRKRRAA